MLIASKKLIVLWLILLMAFSCSEKDPQPAASNEPKIAPPKITALANLPDSIKPVKILLKKPVRRIKAGKPFIHSFLDSATHLVKPIEEQAGGFFTNYTTDDGLALDFVWCSATDKEGNLWFGTDGGGVSRFDGKSFTNYTMKHGLLSDIVLTITQDRNGDLWFGTPSGVSRFDGRSFKNYTPAEGLGKNEVVSIFEDKSGKLWFGTIGGGLSRYDGEKFVNLTTADGLADNRVSAIAEDNAGNLWIGTVNGISCYDGKRFTKYTFPELRDNVIIAIAEDNQNNIWVGTVRGLFQYSIKEFGSNPGTAILPTKDIRWITKDREGNIWVCTAGDGVLRYDGSTFTRFTTTNGLSTNNVESVSEDKTGNLWFTTRGGGITRYGGKSFMNYTAANGLGDYAINRITEGKAGDIWFGKSGGGVVRYDGKSFSTYTVSQGLAHNDAMPLLKDKKGNIWIVTGPEVSCFNGESFTHYTKADGLDRNGVNSIVETREGNIWFGAGDQAATCYDGGSFTKYSEIHGLPVGTIICMIADTGRGIWFITTKGLGHFDGSSFITYTTINGFPSNPINCSGMDRAGNIWLGTMGGGVSRFDGKSFMNFTVAQGLPNNSVWAIVIDSAGKIIFGTNAGLAVLTHFNGNPAPGKKPLTRPAQNDLKNNDLENYTPQFEIYNASAGYPIKDLVGQTMIEDSKGFVWLGTGAVKTGLIRFDYSSVHKEKEPAIPVLHNVKINNENICWHDLLPRSLRNDTGKNGPAPHITEEATTLGFILTELDRDSMRSKFKEIKFDSIRRFYPIPENLVLPYRHNHISVDFGSVELNRPNMVKYQYILEGYDKDWSPVSNRTSVTFGNIHEGTYHFKLRAQSPFGFWSDAIVYTFKVLPPWYRTWWAYLFYALFLIGSILAFIQYRSRNLRKEKQLLEEKVVQRTNELSLSLDQLKQTQAQLIQSEKMASLGELTAGIAHEIQNPLNFVNNFSEVSKEMMDEMRTELSTGNLLEATEIANDVQQNLEKILHHGKRADAIVKGMLEHSRSSSGSIEPTNINALANEYLRLSYHGMRAKDKTFNATIKMDFDKSISTIDIIPKDIGRVLLNLYNNAFYAVTEKVKKEIPGYEPTVLVSTKREDNKSDSNRIIISVKDNGNGIPQKITGKIFQPFFTTKPTGEGTGLGLSLSYDIVKAHGGEIKVETKEGEGSEFVIQLPVV